MKILFFCPRWGAEKIPFPDFVEKALKDGYDGVEISWPENQAAQNEFMEVLKSTNIPFILQHWQTDKSAVGAYIAEYSERMELFAGANPLFINSQTGKDFFSFDDNCRVIEKSVEIEKSTGIRVYQETHRGKFSFACHVMPGYLNAFPEMKITADFSHWLNVSESLLEHQQETIDKIIPHVRHIHARVGHPQGAQVNHPGSPENQSLLERHLKWWDAIIRERKQKGATVFTITPEFGPVPYMPTLPFTQQPVSNQWEINTFMMNLLRRRYNN